MLYFSYGSNMSLARLLQRAPSIQCTGRAVLGNHELRFHKAGQDGSAKCDAYETHDAESYVVGVLYKMDHLDKGKLDLIEGLGKGYNEKEVCIQTEEGKHVNAFTYYAVNIDKNLFPYHWYKEHVLRGARQNGLPGHYIKSIESISSIKDPDQLRHKRELAIYR